MAGAGKSTGTGASEALQNFARGLLKSTRPVRKEVLNQTEEALKTGGVGARIPIVQRAVEASRAAGSQSISGTIASLAKAGISGTPFAERILADTRRNADFDTSMVKSNIINQIVGQAPNVAAAFTGIGVNSLATGGQLEQQNEQFNALGEQAFYKDLKESLMSIGTACFPAGTLVRIRDIDGSTPWVPIESIALGDVVCTLEGFAPVRETNAMLMTPAHFFVQLVVGGETVTVSHDHPIAGRHARAILPGVELSGKVVSANVPLKAHTIHAAYDLTIDSPSGEYMVWPGIFVQSSLDPRHKVEG